MFAGIYPCDSYLIDVPTRQIIATFPASSTGIFIDGGRKILFAAGSASLSVYDIASKQTQSIGNPLGGSAAIYSMEENADGSLIGIAGDVAGVHTGGAAILDGKTLKLLWTTALPCTGVGVSFSPTAPCSRGGPLARAVSRPAKQYSPPP